MKKSALNTKTEDQADGALSAHELYKNEHKQLSKGLLDGLNAHFPIESKGGRISVSVDDVSVDMNKANDGSFNLTKARYEGKSFEVPIRATVTVKLDGKIADQSV